VRVHVRNGRENKQRYKKQNSTHITEYITRKYWDMPQEW
jgi:hypothetical protein